MKKHILTLASVFIVGTAAVPALVVAGPVGASNESALCQGAGGTWTSNPDLPNGGSCSNGTGGRTVAGTIQQATDALLFIIGAIAVLMIIVGGIRYATSAGDQNALTSAKNTILYSVIGLVVAFMAYAIVRFIISAFKIT